MGVDNLERQQHVMKVEGRVRHETSEGLWGDKGDPDNESPSDPFRITHITLCVRKKNEVYLFSYMNCTSPHTNGQSVKRAMTASFSIPLHLCPSLFLRLSHMYHTPMKLQCCYIRQTTAPPSVEERQV